jgi:DNA-nicking Smr family endonuclease
MKDVLDLHGMNHNEAIEKSEDFLMDISVTTYFDGTLITGNSKTLQEKIIKYVLNKHNFNYYIPTWNQGTIIVTS